MSGASTSFSDRFLVTAFRDGGLVLDLETGSYFRLNATATFICRAFADGAPPRAVATELVRRFGLALDVAAADVDSVASSLLVRSPTVLPRNPLSFDPVGGEAFVLACRRVPVLRLESAGTGRLHLALLASGYPGSIVFDWVAPHLLALFRQPLLHASAIERAGRVTAFTGESGAGKTALGRTFAALGASLVSEDLLLLARDEPGLAIVDGEPWVQEWTEEKGRRLEADGVVEVEAEETSLLGSASMRRVPLGQILVVDRRNRRGTTIAVERLAPSRALAVLLDSGFTGLRGAWRGFFHACEAIVGTAEVGCATVPDGLPGLWDAAVAYTRKTAS